MNNLPQSPDFSWNNTNFLNEQRHEMFTINQLSPANEAIRRSTSINFDVQVGYLAAPITAFALPSTTFAHIRPRAPALAPAAHNIDNQRNMILHRHVREGVSGLAKHNTKDHKVSIEVLKKVAIKLLNTKLKGDSKIGKDFPVQDYSGELRVLRVGGYKRANNSEVFINFAYYLEKTPKTLTKLPFLVNDLYSM
jgi:hypothetical protein